MRKPAAAATPTPTPVAEVARAPQFHSTDAGHVVSSPSGATFSPHPPEAHPKLKTPGACPLFI
jgi:hypothetical protein